MEISTDDFFLDLKKGKSSAAFLFDEFKQFRTKLIELTGNYEWNEDSFEIKPLSVNRFETKVELRKLVEKMVHDSALNYKEDGHTIIDLYLRLSHPEMIGNTSWEKYHFKNLTPLSALAKLTNLQNDILKAKQLAMCHWFSKIGCGTTYSFDNIIPIVTGPLTAHANDTIEFKVFLAAFDSTGDPVVKINKGEGDISYLGDGVGRVKVCLPKGIHILTGIVAIQNKSGILKTEEWEYKVNVLD